jgi:hypothetical protein
MATIELIILLIITKTIIVIIINKRKKINYTNPLLQILIIEEEI